MQVRLNFFLTLDKITKQLFYKPESIKCIILLYENVDNYNENNLLKNLKF